MSLFGLMQIIKTMIIDSNKLFVDLVEKKVIILLFILEAFDSNLAEINFFSLKKFLLNKYLSMIFVRM